MLTRRRERQAERRQRLDEEGNDSTSQGDDEARQNQRRNLGFMRYAEENRRSSQTMDRTREHARQIAMALSKEEDAFAADFSNAFGGDPFAGFEDTTESTTHTDNFDFFGGDPFGNNTAATRPPSRSSSPVVRRTAWDASPITKKAPVRATRQQQTPERKPPTQEASNSSAAARRRMRMNIRQKEQTTPQRETAPRQTPPNSQRATPQRTITPQKVKSQTVITPQKSQRHTTPQKSTHQHDTPQKTTTHQRSTRNATRDTAVESTDHLFDIQKTSGFSFDAFGLDGDELQKNVHQAMDELFEDDEFAPQHWSSDDEVIMESPEKISERSSLTDSANGQVNMFKEQPGYHKPRKVVRPLEFFDPAAEGKASVRTESTSATTVTDVGKLRSQWEVKSPPVQQQPAPARQKLKPADIHRLQYQLGSEILSPEKVEAQRGTPNTSFFDAPSSKSDGGVKRPGVKSIFTSFETTKPRSDVVGSPLERRKARLPSFESQAMRLVQTHSPLSDKASPRNEKPQNDIRAQIKKRVTENRKKASPISAPKKTEPEFSNVQLRPVTTEKKTDRWSPEQQNVAPNNIVTERQNTAVSEVAPAKRTEQSDQRSYASSPPQHDIRAQIKQRVAAATKKYAPPGPDSSGSSDDVAVARSNLRSVKSPNERKHSSPAQPYRSNEANYLSPPQSYRTSDMRHPDPPQTYRTKERTTSTANQSDEENFDAYGAVSEEQQRASPHFNRFEPQRIEQQASDPDLTMPTDSEESDADLINSVSAAKAAASAAISRSLMMNPLQQPQNRTDTGKSETSSHSILKKLNVDSGSDVVTDTTDDNHMKTPKATKMMLNAFLAGRESIASGEGLPSTKASDVIETKDGSKTTPSCTSALPALKDDPQYERYFKMLKIGMPMDVVKHAMIRDGVDPSVMDGDHNKPVGIPLKDDPQYAKYFKMLSIGLPMEAIKHSMARDGIDPSVMDQDHDMPAAKQKNHVEQPKEQDSHRRARLHWKTLRKVTSNSLWAQIDKDTNFDIEIDEDEFQELFQAEKTVPSRSDATRSAANKRNSSVCVIDSKRANNGGIILARLKMSHDDMADAVDRIDEGAMTAEQIEQIIEYLPSKEERKALESYMLEGGQDAAEKFDALCECEKFMVSMMTVKHAKRKVSAILFKLQFETCIRDIQKEAHLIEKACGELRNSSRLRQLFGIVLTFGNRLNTAGNGKRKAGAFTLDSLLKLRQAKAFDKKTTFLHYIVKIVRKNNASLLSFKEDIPTVFEADKIFWDQCIADLEQVENQLENVRKIALYQAHQCNAYRLRRRNKKDDPDESLTDDDIEMSLEEELETLRATHIGVFTLSAIKYVSSLRENVESTKKMFARLLEYFGEEESAIQPHELFSIMVSFSRDFEKAKDEVVEREKKQQREERQQEIKRTPVKTPQRSQQKSPMLRSSNLQPNLGSVLKQLKTSTIPLRRTNSDGAGDQPVQAPPRQQSDRRSDTSIPSHSNAALQKTNQSHNSRNQSPFHTENSRSSPVQSTPKSPRSPNSTSITMSAMRAKTRLRRHRTPAKQTDMSSISSPISPPAMDSPHRNRASPAAPAYDSGAEQPSSPRSPRNNGYAKPLQQRDEQLSPRSSSALRMKRRMQQRVRMRNSAI